MRYDRVSFSNRFFKCINFLVLRDFDSSRVGFLQCFFVGGTSAVECGMIAFAVETYFTFVFGTGSCGTFFLMTMGAYFFIAFGVIK